MDIGIGGPIIFIIACLYLFDALKRSFKLSMMEYQEEKQHQEYLEHYEENRKKEQEEFERRLQEASKITEERKKDGTFLGIWGEYGQY